MKNKILFILIAVIIFSNLSFAQVKSKKVDISWGSVFQEKKEILVDIIGHDETGLYTLKQKKHDLLLVHYNNNLQATKSIELNLKNENKKERILEQILFLNNEIYVFSSFSDKKTKINSLFLEHIDKETLLADGDLEEIAHIDYSEFSRWNNGGYESCISRDSSKILVYYQLPYDKDQNEEIGFIIFDRNMKQLWKKEITVPYKDKLFFIEDYLVDNSGNVHLLGVIFKDKARYKKRGEANYHYQILSYYDEGETEVEYPVEIENKFITDMQITINDNQNIICAGFYSDEGTSSIIGSYFLTLDSKTKNIIVENYKKFDIDFITQNLTDRQENKTKKKSEKGKNIELFEYDLNNIILREDGGAILVGEQYYVRVSHYTTYVNGVAQTHTTYYYYFNDIIVINYNPKGEIEWNVKIPKRQVSTNDGGPFSSYVLNIVDDKMYFIFNDHPKNLFYKGNGKLYYFNGRSKESLVVLVELGLDGEFEKEALFSKEDAEVMTRPLLCKQISDREMILYGTTRKTGRFAKITYK